jgi:hypothetical protein
MTLQQVQHMYAMFASDKIMCVDHASTCVSFGYAWKHVKHAHETYATLCFKNYVSDVSLVIVIVFQCLLE